MFLGFILVKKWKWKSLVVSDSVTPWTIQSLEFSRPEYWSGSLSLLQGIFPTQESKWSLLHCSLILYQLSLIPFDFLVVPTWYKIYHFTYFKEDSSSFTSTCYCLSFFNYNSPSGYEVSHDFDLNFSDDSWYSPSFLMQFVLFNICFIEISTLILCPYLSLYCWVSKSSLYIMDTSPLSGIWFIIFSHSVGCLFTFLMGPFDAHVFMKSLMKSYLSLLLLFVLWHHI